MDNSKENLPTRELADLADSHNPAAYAALCEENGGSGETDEAAFRRGLLEILRGSEGPHPTPFGPVRTVQVASLIDQCGGDLWGEHPDHPKADWKYEVENGDTFLGYWEWVWIKIDEAGSEG